jgi:hypothetical protein
MVKRAANVASSERRTKDETLPGPRAGRQSGPRRVEPVPASYEERTRRSSFRAGIARLLELAGRRRAAVMCRERDPLDCYRLHLVCRHLRPLGGEFRHILPDGHIEPQAEVERRLLERAGAAPLPLFEGAPDDTALARAYDAVWWDRR